jgi:5-methylcytosine-specific restriction endonuclease McrA
MSDSSIPEHSCRKCSVSKPYTSTYFYSSGYKGMLQTICKSCHNKGLYRKPAASSKKAKVPRLRHVCIICNVEKTYSREFFAYANKSTGQLRTQCLTCMSAKARTRPATQRIRHLAKAVGYSRKYRAENRAKVYAATKAWWAANPDAMRAAAARRRAKKRSVGGTHTPADIAFKFESQKGRCYWCQQELESGKFHVDHIIPISKGGPNGPENICCACPSCNLKKHNKMPHEFAGRLF